MTRAERDEREMRRRIRARFEREAERLPSKRPIATSHVSRRTFLMGVAASGLVLPRGIAAQGTPIASPADAGIASDPFILGIASGEPEPEGIVLWTRIAPTLFEEHGGVGAASVEVAWEVATDERMTEIVQQGTYATDAAWAHSVHVEVDGLEPAREYWYRFRFGEFESAIGRTKTAPAPGTMPGGFRFAFVSCQRWDHGLYTALRDMAVQAPDLVVHLGDYIYENEIEVPDNLADAPERSTAGIPEQALEETVDLEDYRHRYAICKRDPDLQAAHLVAPWLVTWDDHEVANNYYGAVIGDLAFVEPLLERRAAAYQAYWEHMPLRERARPKGPDMRLYRSATFGDLIRFNVLDTRQYRSEQVDDCVDDERLENAGYCAGALDPERTMLGEAQKQWLFDGFGETAARWSVLAQQVTFSRIDLDDKADEVEYGGDNMDTWDAYAAERNEVLEVMADAAAQQGFQPLVITGDVHRNYVWDIKRDWDAPGSETAIGTEFVGTSITSNGDEPLYDNGGFTTICGGDDGNEHNHLYDNHRGYVLVDVGPDALHTVYRVASSVEDPDGDVSTLTSFVVDHGSPGAQVDETCRTVRP